MSDRGGREGAVAERTNDLEDHLIGHAIDDVHAPTWRLNPRGIAVKPAIPQHQRAGGDFPQQRTGQAEFVLLSLFDEGLEDDVRAGFGEKDQVNGWISAVHGFAVPSCFRSAEGGPGAPGLPGGSGPSQVTPAMAIRRMPLYKAPRVRSTAMGAAVRRKS